MTSALRPRSLLLTLVVSLACANALGAQDLRVLDRFPSSTAARRLAATMDSFPKPIADRLAAVIDSAANDALPMEPIFLRALEGRVKRASPEMIVAVVSRLRLAMTDVRRTLGPRLTTAELTAAAAAVQAGVSRQQLVALQSLRGKQSIVTPIDAWLGLVAHGALPDRAWARVEQLARAQAPDVEFERLRVADLKGTPPGSRP